MSASHKDQKLEFKGLPGIHYIWVGPPSPEKDKKTEIGIEIKGHDTDGPMAMAKANKDNPIYFWCLDNHVKQFQDKFKEQKNIHVLSIQDYLNSYNNQMPSQKKTLVPKIFSIFSKFFLDKEVDQITVNDRVTIKDAFALFLHATGHNEEMQTITVNKEKVKIEGNGICTLDTSTKPIKARDLKILYREGFRVPYLDNTSVDCWIMQSSNSEKASKVFLNYYSYLIGSKYDTGQAITFALSSCRDKPEHYLATETIVKDKKYILTEFDVVKSYFNTHKADAKLSLDSGKDIDPYKQAIELTKEYICNHPWQLNGKGKIIKKGSPIPKTDIHVPHIVYKQWQIINADEKKPSKETFLKLCQLIMKDEQNPSFRFFKGKRQDDTSNYLKLFPYPEDKNVDVQQYIFGVTVRIEQDKIRYKPVRQFRS